ncbi:TRAP-type C4-dicarboxylate transport system, small permease component [Palleronia marisminoris]|uniref:TRAP transporter small permease protein n=1 Tax=Palleronia marisminoris TaxID=315423 RepID=A0A1Y5TPF4_9RHOB|nr:TRAP transporter small permease [Palleronia marisminoris]SFH47722.1 TRAP-type C4-dicarboxylate transport system, small permease component [Palleronia marisminoris]SLN68880.1 2,3-diketo-L-gulonate TRAP transporter small permease protein YiaM [Palleronia marisminoris]
MRRILEIICVLLLGALVTVPFVQVIARDVFGSAIVGAEELTRFLLICSVFAAYPLVVNHGENIVMGELLEALPPRANKIVNFLISFGAIATCGFLGLVAIINISENLNNATPTLKIPFWIFMGATAFGFVGACVVHLFNLRRQPKAHSSVSL